MKITLVSTLATVLVAVGCKNDSPSTTSPPPATAPGPGSAAPAVAAKATDSSPPAAAPATDPATALTQPLPAGFSTIGSDVELPPRALTGDAPSVDRKVDVDQIQATEVDELPVQKFGGVSTARGFRVSYLAPTETDHKELQASLEKARVFESLAESLNGLVRLPRSVDVQVGACGMVNAFWDPRRKRVVVCYELMQYFAGLFATSASKAGAKPTPQQLASAVMGATNFAFFHEVGHGLIDVLDLAAVGRQEDAVDQLATLILIGGGEQGVGMALAAAYWFKIQHEAGKDRTPFSDEHAFDGQRYFNILCLVYGSDPARYADLARSGALPKSRADRCPREFQEIAAAWEKLLRPHLANRAAVRVRYQPPIDPSETEGGEDDLHALTADPVAASTPGLKPLPPDMQAKYDALPPDKKAQFDELRRKAAGQITAGKAKGCEVVKTMLARNKLCADQAAQIAAVDCAGANAFAEATRINNACVEVLRAKGEEYKAAARPNSCEKVATHARSLLLRDMLDTAKTLPPDQRGNLGARVKAELPAFQEALLAECAQKAWSDADRDCVLSARTLADARSRCKM